MAIVNSNLKSKLKPAKQVLIFNSTKTLIAIARSVRSACEITNGNLQSISFACTGRLIASDGLYFRHLDDRIEISMEDLGSLQLTDYDKLCGSERKYHTMHEMAKRKQAKRMLKKQVYD